jgi:hypothetical protein
VQQSDFSRPNHISPNLIILDGISGTGKTMIMRFLDSLEQVHVPGFDYTIEQLLLAKLFGKLDEDALKCLFSLQIDQRLYDREISREINFRLRDLSSVFRSRRRLSYLKNLFASDVNFDLNEHGKNALVIVVHQLLDAASILSEIYPGLVRQILCVRHPYYLFEHWLSYVGNFGNNPRDFTVTMGDKGIPWFLNSQRSDFSDLSMADRAALCISDLIERQESLIGKSKDLFLVDFERFVLEPNNYLAGIEIFVGKKMKSIQSNLRKESLPRVHINASRNLPIYRKYGANQLKTDLSHQNDFAARRNKIFQSVSKKTFQQLEAAAYSYESRFGLWFK